MLAFLGGTGPEGRGLALRLALAGEEVVIGSRDPVRASAAAEELTQLAPGSSIHGAGNEDAAAGLRWFSWPSLTRGRNRRWSIWAQTWTARSLLMLSPR